jgi:hypothetical protein
LLRIARQMEIMIEEAGMSCTQWRRLISEKIKNWIQVIDI